MPLRPETVERVTGCVLFAVLPPNYQFLSVLKSCIRSTNPILSLLSFCLLPSFGSTCDFPLLSSVLSIARNNLLPTCWIQATASNVCQSKIWSHLLSTLRLCAIVPSLHCSVCIFIYFFCRWFYSWWKDNQIDTHHFNLIWAHLLIVQIILQSSDIVVIGPTHQFINPNLTSLMLIAALHWPLIMRKSKTNTPALIKRVWGVKITHNSSICV